MVVGNPTAATPLPDRSTVGQVARTVGAFAAAGLCGFAAAICLLAALWVFIEPYVGPAGAPLIVAGILMIAAFAIIAGERSHRVAATAPTAPAMPPNLSLDDILRLVREHKSATLMGAVVAGALAARNDRS